MGQKINQAITIFSLNLNQFEFLVILVRVTNFLLSNQSNVIDCQSTMIDYYQSVMIDCKARSQSLIEIIKIAN